MDQSRLVRKMAVNPLFMAYRIGNYLIKTATPLFPALLLGLLMLLGNCGNLFIFTLWPV